MNTHIGNYDPASFGWIGKYDPLQDRSVLVPFTHSGVSFGLMNRYVVDRFTAFLDELVPHLPGGLHAGKCGCYNPASKSSGGGRSFHTYAIAIDVNWDTNPMDGASHDNPDRLSRSLCAKYGLEWGGDWQSPHDPMHYEIALSPQDSAYELDVLNMTPAELTKLVREAVRTELSNGVIVNGLRGTDNNDSDPTKLDPHYLETFLNGIPGYTSVAKREAK